MDTPSTNTTTPDNFYRLTDATIADMGAQVLAATCDHYERIIAGMDADDDADRIAELQDSVNRMEWKLESIARHANDDWVALLLRIRALRLSNRTDIPYTRERLEL